MELLRTIQTEQRDMRSEIVELGNRVDEAAMKQARDVSGISRQLRYISADLESID